MYDHPENHEPSVKPVLGCALCDKEAGRPVQRRHGLGSSSATIPRESLAHEPEE